MQKVLRTDGHARAALAASASSGFEVLAVEQFVRMLALERKRTERSRRPFVLMLLNCGRLLKDNGKQGTLGQVLSALSHSTRETDVTGWYREASVIGVIFTEIGSGNGKSVVNALLMKVTNALCSHLSIEEIDEVSVSFHVFPDDWERHGSDGAMDPALYPDLGCVTFQKIAARFVKRAIDVVGSLLALIFLSPLLVLISVAIKATSPGPLLFRQKRLGFHRKTFQCLKFRSMYAANDPSIHQAYMQRLIAGEATANGKAFKLTADPRVTRVGRLLRKTSLDELPQFWNVLMGDMSLVGPRPPIPYEYHSYAEWHKRRLLSVKPGITGLWQVSGRCRLKFDEMVRLDLEYSKSWSLWLDLKILLRTPWAVVSGEGAY